jgi:hypothetical protein
MTGKHANYSLEKVENKMSNQKRGTFTRFTTERGVTVNKLEKKRGNNGNAMDRMIFSDYTKSVAHAEEKYALEGHDNIGMLTTFYIEEADELIDAGAFVERSKFLTDEEKKIFKREIKKAFDYFKEEEEKTFEPLEQSEMGVGVGIDSKGRLVIRIEGDNNLTRLAKFKPELLEPILGHAIKEAEGLATMRLKLQQENLEAVNSMEDAIFQFMSFLKKMTEEDEQ